jgi:hypothetical protein
MRSDSNRAHSWALPNTCTLDPKAEQALRPLTPLRLAAEASNRPKCMQAGADVALRQAAALIQDDGGHSPTNDLM